MSRDDGFEYDWLVIGSGFGGSVAALRLREKGYSVGVLECGRRFADDEYREVRLGYPAVLLDAQARLQGHPAADVHGQPSRNVPLFVRVGRIVVLLARPVAPGPV